MSSKKRKREGPTNEKTDEVIGTTSLSDRCRIISRDFMKHLSGSRPPRRRASLPLLFHSDRQEMKQSRKRARLSLGSELRVEKCCRGWQSLRRGKRSKKTCWTAPWPWMERSSEVAVECCWSKNKMKFCTTTSPPPAKVGLAFKPAAFKTAGKGKGFKLVLTNVEFIPGKATITLTPSNNLDLRQEISGESVPIGRMPSQQTADAKEVVVTEVVNPQQEVTVTPTPSMNSPSCNAITFVLQVPARSKMTLLNLPGMTSLKEVEAFSVTDDWIFGSPELSIDRDYRWMFPIQDVGPVLCCQGFDGPHTHEGDLRYAIDLAIFEGTKIYCPRDGVVVDFKDDSNIGGGSSKHENDANYLSIVHQDGSCSEFVHLDHKGVKVSLGEYVERGSLIGLSGNTGFTFGPHLHFHVKSSPDENAYTIPIKFDDGGEGFVMEEGDFYDPFTNKIIRKKNVVLMT